MSSSAFADREALRPVQSRLGQSLLRLSESMEQHRQQETRAESLFADWQRKWSSRRKQISRRLALIEQQLAGLDDAHRGPQLNVVCVAGETEELSSAASV